MLLILSVTSLSGLLTGRHPKMDLLDVPRYAHDELGLHGLAIPTALLRGAEGGLLDKLRRSADKAACPVLMLQEDAPQPLADPRRTGAAIDRLRRVFSAAERLGCSAAAFGVKAPDKEEALPSVTESLKSVMGIADKLGLNMLIRPTEGLTEHPDRMTELIKQVGGFRIGALPDFEAAAATGDPAHYLRRLAPYASIVIGSAVVFDKAGRHTSFDLERCVGALVDVGYDATIGIEYRGKGDPAQGVVKMRDALLQLFEEASA